LPSYVDPRTEEKYAIDTPIWRSPSGNPLMISPLPGIRQKNVIASTRSIWRYRDAFPLDVSEPISMGEGCMPLVDANYCGIQCSFKLEWFSPTGSFKDRGTSVMLSLLRKKGIQSVLEDS